MSPTLRSIPKWYSIKLRTTLANAPQIADQFTNFLGRQRGDALVHSYITSPKRDPALSTFLPHSHREVYSGHVMPISNCRADATETFSAELKNSGTRPDVGR
jgi:hypothetical protein